MKCIKPVTLRSGITVPCGYCINCRVNRTQMWKLRLCYELSNWDDASFVTLTFDNEHLGVNSLDKRDLQTFFKRLRKSLAIEYGTHDKVYSDGSPVIDKRDGLPVQEPNKPIKYYAVGEYGSKTQRKHYHAIIFGLSPYVDKERELIAQSWLPRCEAWQFDRSRGVRSAIGTVTPDSIRYVAGYIQKKLVGQMAKDVYKGRTAPFMICSQRLGLDFAEKNRQRLEITKASYLQGKRIPLPRYFRDKLGIGLNEHSTKSVESFQSDIASLREAFEREVNMKVDSVNPEAYMRRYELWEDSYLYEYADEMLRAFEKRSKLKLMGDVD